MAEVTGMPVFRGRRIARISIVVAIVGFVLLAIGLFVNPERTWLSYLMAFAFVFTTAVGALILLMIGYAANARWMSVVRRTTEAVMLPMPALVVLFVPLLFGIDWLYPWHTPSAALPAHERAIYEHRSAFLNIPFFAIRAAVYFAVLLLAGMLLRRWSLRRDRITDQPPPADPVEALSRERKFASGMLPPVGLAFSFAVIDWLMSQNGTWYSSMYPVALFGGGFLTAIAMATVLTARVWQGHAADVVITPNHFHALGRMMFAFLVFWAYTAFFQALLIRIANKPEEVTFYLQRTSGMWAVFTWILIIGHFAIPFFVLLPKRIKFRPRAMAIAGWWLVAMHLIDIYWLVIPVKAQGWMVFSWLDLAALAAVVGTSVAVAAWRQDGLPFVPVRDPFLADGAVYRSKL